MSRILAVLAVVVTCACSSGTTSQTGPTGPVAPTTADAAPTPVAITREECEAMVMHVIDLGIAEQGSAATGDRDTMRAEMEPLVTECVATPPTRDQQRCALAAKTLDEVAACDPPVGSAGDAK